VAAKDESGSDIEHGITLRERDGLAALLAEAQANEASWQERIATLEAQLRRAQAELAAFVRFAHETDRLRRDVAALRRSTSWRITAPLRKLARALLRLRHLWR
jgi:hypothetical protein